MEILFGIMTAVGLFAWWLTGHWFMRWVATVLFAVLGFLIGAALYDSGLIALIGVALAWPIASVPAWIMRARYRRMIRPFQNYIATDEPFYG